MAADSDSDRATSLVERTEQPATDLLERKLSLATGLLPQNVKARLTTRYPVHAEVFATEGVILGVAPPAVIADTWLAALDELIRRCNDALPELLARLRRADQLELVSELVAASASSALFGLLLKGSEPSGKTSWPQIAAAILTLLGTWAAVLSRSFRRTPGGGNLFDSYKALVALSAEADVLRLKYRAWHEGGRTPPELGDRLALDIVRVVTDATVLLRTIAAPKSGTAPR